ncbi:hypothetical protein FYJ24_01050 [Actinomycetaceae bacterium WB03_NA08]|uniref:Uncharacterized protein n=1 Tax=Scrofimicrobium canadense TaxID=2652290 RepID=A0A6N7W1V2_9ACTO|nr:hypothetical protein [Scrofimicrobium canadense]MSS83371.1 hypothetical protein [Scrofimicrobium canadense]
MRSLRSAGATAPDAALRDEAQRIIALWDGAALNPRYLCLVLERLDEIDGPSPEPAVLRLGAAYRGTYPDSSTGLDASTSQRIRDLGQHSEDACVPGNDLEAQLVADAYLAAQALSPQAYRKFLTALRQQFSEVTDVAFQRRRSLFLQRVLSRPRILRTPFAAKWESALRENLEGELARIETSCKDGDFRTETSDTVAKGPIVIRRSTQKKIRIAQDAGESHKPVTPPELTTERALDDTSSLEDIADLFAHKRSKGTSPQNN